MNTKKNNIMSIQNKFYESLKQKEKMYKKLDEKKKNNIEENNINTEFRYPYYIYQEIKKKEKQEQKSSISQQYQEEVEQNNINKKNKTNGEKYNKNIQLIKTNVDYNIIYEY